ncbi:hypothetical protein B0T16DRAFT_330001 [Cercophora newfieldiana]|uniref:DUF6594 domain-containing protein n=1 Tax=Cercophora newfieldiana TaxID=92897 RepID=A0AA39Y6G4_9PEZI|nr:hypothetical protein B0T16DRAFT_330001 [Cercophora newfieldiana]
MASSRPSSQGQQSTGNSSNATSTSHRPSVSTSEIQARPWQYLGYKHYSELISSTDEFFIVRRFAALNGRVILNLQNEIVKLEARLRNLDDDNHEDASPRNNGSFEYDEGTEKAELLSEIQVKLYQYSTYLDEENEADLICLASASSDKEPLRRLIDHSQALRTLSIWRDTEKQEQRPGCDVDGVLYFSDSKMDRSVSLVIAFVGLVMLVTPVWALHSLGDNMIAKLVTITVFVLVCLAVVSFAMVAKPFEALGTTAAYAAVLMVFLQLGTPNSSSE